MSIYFAFDLETTGISINEDHPVQIAYALVDSETGSQTLYKRLIHTDRPIDPRAEAVHHISREQTAQSGITPEQLKNELVEVFANNKIEGLIAYNGKKFDVPLLYNFFKKVLNFEFNQFINTPLDDPALWYLCDEIYKIDRPVTEEEIIRVSRKRPPKGSRFKLGIVCQRYGIDFNESEAHEAEYDTTKMIQLWRRMKGLTDSAVNEIELVPVAEVELKPNLADLRIEKVKCDYSGEVKPCLVLEQKDQFKLNISLSVILDKFKQEQANGRV